MPLTFPAGKTHSIDSWYTGRIQSGVPSLVNNGKVSCEPDSSS